MTSTSRVYRVGIIGVSAFFAEPRQGLVPDNVMGLYDRIHADLETGGHTAPSFADAVANHGIVEAITLSSELGRRIRLSELDGLRNSR